MKRIIQWFRNGGFSTPPSPHIATVECEVGKTTLRLTRDGGVVAVLVLHDLTRRLNEGTEARFVDLARYLEGRRYRD